MFGCAAKVKIYELSDGAFVENNKSIFLSSNENENMFPLFNRVIMNNLSSEIKQDGFLIDNKNFGYTINVATKSHDQFTTKSSRQVVDVYEHCYYDYDGTRHIQKCVTVTDVYDVPCINISSSTLLNINATNIDKNSTINFVVNNKGSASNCIGFRLFQLFNNDESLYDSLNKDNIKAIVRKIKNSIFPIKTVKTETLYKKIESINASKETGDLFALGYSNVKNEKYIEAINIYENIKNQITTLPNELLFNLGVLYEYLGNLDKSLENYNLLDENFVRILGRSYVSKESFIKRVTIKKRYE